MFSDLELQEKILKRLDQSVVFLDLINCQNTKSFIEAWFFNPHFLSEVIDWHEPRKEIDIKLFLTSLIGSFQYALILNNYDIENLVSINNKTEWNALIKNFLSKPEIKKIIQNNIWRKSTLQLPKRTDGLEEFLSEYFKDKQILSTDLGCGLHINLPILFASKNRIVYTAKGIGIDIQPRDFEWARANVWPEKFYLDSVEVLKNYYKLSKNNEEKFPFHQDNLLDLSLILAKYYQGVKLDLVLTSFVRHQLENDLKTQNKILDVICKNLENNGLWVDIGEELILENNNLYQEWPVRIYKKADNHLEFLCSPFSLKPTFDAILWKNQ